MEALAWIVLLGTALGLALVAPRWRLRRALARPLPPDGAAVLERNVLQYAGMAAEEQAQLQKLVKQFLHQKKFIACADLELTDEMRLTIAGQACLLQMNRAGLVFPRLHTVLLYPNAFVAPRSEVDAAGVVTETRQGLLGESWDDGRVVLSWEHVRRAGHDHPAGQNVVLHEFAHQLDSESGNNNGAPDLGSRARYRSWSQVLARDFAGLRSDALFGHAGVLDHYGASSPAEFFAVATESFFEQPYRMAARHPALFAELAAFYRVDPRAWCAAPALPDPEPGLPCVVYGQWQ